VPARQDGDRPAYDPVCGNDVTRIVPRGWPRSLGHRDAAGKQEMRASGKI